MTDDATIVLLFVPALQNLEKFFFPAGALVKFGGEPAVQAASIIGFFFGKDMACRYSVHSVPRQKYL